MATETTISRPAPFIETMGKTFGEGIMSLLLRKVAFESVLKQV